jgi:Fic family protein
MENTVNLFLEKREAFKKLNLQEAINWEMYNNMTISHHSTAIEGSTLTEVESQVLLENGITPKGKPLEHSVMEKDHYNALRFVVKQGQEKKSITPEYIRAVSARVMHGTGKEYNVAIGSFDSSRGEYRKIGVFAGNTSFPDYPKVENLVKQFCKDLAKKIDKVKTPEEIYGLAFIAHYDLVSIHPFADGNGRVSRLIMNHVLAYHKESPALVHKESRQEYIISVGDSQKNKDPGIMRKFLFEQQTKQFERQIKAHRAGSRDMFLTFLA